MRVTRCFLPGPLACGAVVTLPEAPAAHVRRVLRLRPGAHLTLFDGRGGEYGAQLLESRGAEVRVRIGEHRPIEREAPLKLTLLQGLARGERMDWIVQKATELGICALLPLESARSVVRLDAATRLRRREHWQAVAVGACEQCGRNRVPGIQEICGIGQGCAAAQGAQLRLLLEPDAEVSLAAQTRAALQGAALPADGAALSVALLVGPEGGLEAHELAVARESGFEPCRLGPRILRADTAPIAALAALQALAGDYV